MLRIILGLMGVYLALTVALALKYDWQFFVNDAIALSLFAVLLIVVIVTDPPWRHHR